MLELISFGEHVSMYTDMQQAKGQTMSILLMNLDPYSTILLISRHLTISLFSPSSSARCCPMDLSLVSLFRFCHCFGVVILIH